jgi:hypothetical protein
MSARDAEGALDEAHLNDERLPSRDQRIWPSRMMLIASYPAMVERSVRGSEPLAGHDALLHETIVLLSPVIDVAFPTTAAAPVTPPDRFRLSMAAVYADARSRRGESRRFLGGVGSHLLPVLRCAGAESR